MPELPPKALGRLSRTIGSGGAGGQPPPRMMPETAGDGRLSPPDPGPGYA